jgi:hypothetical protein
VPAKEAPEMERVKEVLHLSLHFLESARSSTRDITLFPAVPKVSNCPLITAVKAAEEVKVSIFDRGYHIIVGQQFVALGAGLIHCLNSFRFVIVEVCKTRDDWIEP